MINKKKPPRYNGKRDSRTGEVLPPINFERDTGWPASQYKEWLAAQLAIISANSEPTGSLSSALAPAPTTNTVFSLNTIR